jgi:hypothetical protein
MNIESIFKHALKTICKHTDLEYDDLKDMLKKHLKMVKNYEENMIQTFEEVMEMDDVSSLEELEDYDINTLKLYCKIKGLDYSGNEKQLRQVIMTYIEETFDNEPESEESEIDLESELESESESEPEKVPEKTTEKPAKTVTFEKEQKKKSPKN